jgi:hypothetical protein
MIGRLVLEIVNKKIDVLLLPSVAFLAERHTCLDGGEEVRMQNRMKDVSGYIELPAVEKMETCRLRAYRVHEDPKCDRFGSRELFGIHISLVVSYE